MRKAVIQISLTCAAFWPVWIWQAQRMSDGSDEPWGILALFTVIAYLICFARPVSPSQFQIRAATVTVLLYVVTFGLIPPLARALLAVITFTFLFSSWSGYRTVHLALLGLLFLSLPVVASLQFYMGYPVRLLTANLAANCLTLIGYPTEASGTALNWAGETIVVNAPCAGIRMLWSGLYVAFTGALLRRFGGVGTWISYSLAVVLIFAGNLLRNIMLFFTESHIVSAPAWMHGAIGIFCLILVASAILATQSYIAKRFIHAP